MRAKKGDLFRTPRFVESMKKSQSLKLCKPAKEPEIILSSSGMANGGRVIEHLKVLLKSKHNTVVFVGHQAEGTNGSTLTLGAENITLDDEAVRIRACVELMEDYSGHGDYEDIMNWLVGFSRKEGKQNLPGSRRRGSGNGAQDANRRDAQSACCYSHHAELLRTSVRLAVELEMMRGHSGFTILMLLAFL